MGGGRDVGEAPLITEYGFHESVTQFEGLGERYLATYETLNLKDSTRQLEKSSALLGKGEIHWEKRYRVTERFVDRAIRAMRHAHDTDRPFYINLWPDDVHTPLEPSPANRGSGSNMTGIWALLLSWIISSAGFSILSAMTRNFRLIR